MHVETGSAVPTAQVSCAVAHKKSRAGNVQCFWSWEAWGAGTQKARCPLSCDVASVENGEPIWLFLDQIKRNKGVWWMPWQQEAMKDVILCDKRRRAENRL